MALSAKQQELKDKLYAIYDNRDFVQGIGPILANDDEVQEMLDYVNFAINRFLTPGISDPISRISRAPISKLGQEDRLVVPSYQ